jgi:predicted ester cyclase
MSIKDFAEKFTKAEDEAWQKGNCDALEKLEDQNVVYHMSAPFGEVVGFEAHKQQILGSRIAASDIKQEWKYLIGEGNLFAFSYKSRVISAGKVPGFPPAGKEFANDGLFLFHVKKGKIIEAWYNGIVTGLDLAAFAGK